MLITREAGGDNGLASMEIRARVLLVSRLNVSRINRAEPFGRSSL